MTHYELKPSLTGKSSTLAVKDVAKAVVNKINDGDRFASSHGLTAAEKDVAAASAQLDAMLTAMYTNMEALGACEKRIAANAKTASSKLKQAAELVGQGVVRMEKAANFDRLERYVSLLERAAVAMTTLGELEKSGKLEKIAEAIR